jgi:hypothetical protein
MPRETLISAFDDTLQYHDGETDDAVVFLEFHNVVKIAEDDRHLTPLPSLRYPPECTRLNVRETSHGIHNKNFQH